ncbi:RNA polymerase II elongation factor ELL isoform X2 [Hydra vulgaris]|uniref:RNA polymerase II elongation factor ELL isoform X2 n=1 Tax=Hydra vulgaris TaxID=6087 RepID=A0ABM4DEA1_HYDVU
MAYTLTEDCTYSLTKKEDEKKRVYFVKLTDSCLKALEEYVTNKVATQRKPTIKFEGQNGAFTIPCRPGSAGKDVCKKFDFVVSKLISVETNPLQGILECIKHTKEEFISYGQLEEKLSVAASDDSYEQTRNRMAQVDQERKDVSTKEIKLDVKKGKKQHKSKPISSEVERRLSDLKKHNSQTVTLKPHNTNQVSPGTNKNSPSLPIKSAVSSKNSPLNNKIISSSLTKTPTMNHVASKSSSLNVVTPKSSLINETTLSCRERVIHVLAIKALKKPELMTRLQKEAMSQKDRNNLPMVLKQVSTLQDSELKLIPALYSEVRVDSWPYYTDSERLIVKRNISMQKGNSALSPQMVTSTSKSPEVKVNSLKRALDVNSTLDSKNIKSFGNEEPSSTSSSSPLHNSAKVRKTESLKENKKPSYEEESPPTVASTSETPEHLVNYKPIITYEQRCQYKRDFQAEYPEYIELKKNCDSITTKFIELDRSWRRQEKGSDEYYRLQNEIIDSYNKQQADEKYKEMKKRCEELHMKLSHIKKLVVDYDNGHM